MCVMHLFPKDGRVAVDDEPRDLAGAGIAVNVERSLIGCLAELRFLGGSQLSGADGVVRVGWVVALPTPGLAGFGVAALVGVWHEGPGDSRGRLEGHQIRERGSRFYKINKREGSKRGIAAGTARLEGLLQ